MRALRYLLFNKPYGVISQFTGTTDERPTLRNYVGVPGVYRWDGSITIAKAAAAHRRRLSSVASPTRATSIQNVLGQVEGVLTDDALSIARRHSDLADFARAPRPSSHRRTGPPPRDPPIRVRLSSPPRGSPSRSPRPQSPGAPDDGGSRLSHTASGAGGHWRNRPYRACTW
jgi:23S rRNA pseudouridine2457 synthase